MNMSQLITMRCNVHDLKISLICCRYESPIVPVDENELPKYPIQLKERLLKNTTKANFLLHLGIFFFLIIIRLLRGTFFSVIIFVLVIFFKNLVKIMHL